MTEESEKNKIVNTYEYLDNQCEECKEKDDSVSQNLIISGFKICNSCRISKTIFPV
tara:strand:+ start:35 stop:202 length:168 start_codon:yes stop_codon:yes gene_type:complete